mgnify:CR=1 FL=1
MTDYPFEAVDLERGAELLDEHGWIQRNEGGRTVGFCAYAAVREAVSERTQVPRPFIGDELAEFLGVKGVEVIAANGTGGIVFHSVDLAGFNDTPGRTKEEVIDLLMLGAKKLRDLGQ